MAKKLWLNENESISIPETMSIDLGEVATRERSMDWTTMGSYLPNPDPVLKAAGIDQTTYRDLLVDAHVGAVVGQRQAGVTTMKWEIEPGDAPANQVDFFQRWVKDLDIARIVSQTLDAPLYGYQPMEVMWKRLTSFAVPYDVDSRPPEWFIFSDRNELLFRSRENYNGELLKPRKLLLARHKATYQNPYGFPILSRCFWWVTFKKGGVKFWVRFSEKYGMPFAVGKLPSGRNEAERQKLLKGMKKMIQDACAVINDDESITLLEAAGKAASVELYERLCQYSDLQISKAAVGQTLTTEIGKTGGAHAAAETHNDVRAEIVDGDSKIVESTMNELIRWVRDVNFATAGALPVFKMYRPEDLEKKAKRDKGIYDLGVRFNEKYFEDEYNLDKKHFSLPVNLSPAPGGAAPALGAPRLPGVSPAPSRAPGTFSEAAPVRALSPNALHLHFSAPPAEHYPDQAALDQALADIPAEQLQGIMDKLLEPVFAIVDRGGTREEVMEALNRTYSEMDVGSLRDQLTNLFFSSAALGRLDASH